MADAEVQILISAIDNISKEVQTISKNLQTMQKDVISNNKKFQKSFDDVSINVLALGQAANRVDTIMSSHTNMQLRLENASERVTGAQERLTEAQYNLNKVTQSGTASASDVTEAQRKVDSSARSLTISQNNQARMQNMVIGTYINIGVQVTNLIAMYPKLVKSVQDLTLAMTGLKISSSVIGTSLAGLGTTMAILTAISIANKKGIDEAGEAYYKQTGKIASADRAHLEYLENLNAHTQFLDANSGKISGEGIWNSLKGGLSSATLILKGYNLETFKTKVLADEKTQQEIIDRQLLEIKTAQIQAETTAMDELYIQQARDLALLEAKTPKEAELLKLEFQRGDVIDTLNKLFEDGKITQEKYNEVMDITTKKYEAQKAAIDSASQSLGEYLGKLISTFGVQQADVKFEKATVYREAKSKGQETAVLTGNATVVRKKDFIVTKSGEIIEPDKNDTIMGFRGAMPTSNQEVVVKNYIYLDGQQIAYQVGRTVAEGLSAR